MSRKPKRKIRKDTRVGPTTEQMMHGCFISAGMAHKRVPVIDTMLTRGQLSDAEHAALRHYRDQASLAERSSVKSCLDRSQAGSGHGPGAAIISALLETSRIERSLGSLCDIARAIAVEDLSLSQWCVNKFGGRERWNGKGEFVAIVPINERQHMKLAQLEIKMAARRIIA